jgi:hypothetical protein
MNEHIIQIQIVKYCKANNILVLSIPNAAKRTPAEIKYFKEEGFYSGASDLLVGINEKIIFVEVKDSKGIQSPKQIEFQKDIESHGFTYILVRSLEDFKKVVDSSKY